jgi:hypothetical protein
MRNLRFRTVLVAVILTAIAESLVIPYILIINMTVIQSDVKPLDLVEAFRDQPFLDAFLMKAKGMANLHRLYVYAVRYHFRELVSSWQWIPRYEGYFDLMSYIPVDATGCPRGFFPALLENSTLIPHRPKRCFLCIFILCVHQQVVHLFRFVSQLHCPEFAFVFSVDKKAKGLRDRLLSRYSSVPGVFIVTPSVPVRWICANVNYQSVGAMQAIVNAGLTSEWVSLHSGFDLAVHSCRVTREFFIRYKGRAEFYSANPIWSSEVRPRMRGGGDCTPVWPASEIQKAMRHIFPNWTLIGNQTLQRGSQWWTLQFATVREVLTFIRKQPQFVLRVGFTHCPDETLIPTILRLLGKTMKPLLRYINFGRRSNGHPRPITLQVFQNIKKRPYLFARKMPRRGGPLAAIDQFVNAEQKAADFPEELTEKNVLGVRMH